MSIHLLLIWDYDTPTGFAVSTHSRQADPMSEYRCTDKILNLLSQHQIPATFACVGKAAESGNLPIHNPAQIRTIHQAGHEIASHSHCHELLPSLPHRQLLETLQRSKATLEACIGTEVVGFVPPWNRPFHYPQKLAFSLKDWQVGKGWWRQSINTLCHALAQTGYQWVRIHYQTPLERLLANYLSPNPTAIRPIKLEKRHAVWTMRLSYCGYDQRLIQWLTTQIQTGQNQTYLIYAHPHAIEHPNSQHWQHLQTFVQWAVAQPIRFLTPKSYLSLLT